MLTRACPEQVCTHDQGSSLGLVPPSGLPPTFIVYFCELEKVSPLGQVQPSGTTWNEKGRLALCPSVRHSIQQDSLPNLAPRGVHGVCSPVMPFPGTRPLPSSTSGSLQCIL